MELDPEELPHLTSKQSAFVQALLGGNNGSDAYREAYDCKNMSDAAVWVASSRLRNSAKVSLWLRHFQRIGLETARLTIERHLAELVRAREFAIAHGQISAAVQAEHYRGKAAGFYEDRLQLMDGRSDEELLKAIEGIFDKETVEAIGAALGYLREARADGADSP
jgi:phage terminase small subunit